MGNDAKKILHVLASLNAGGAESRVVDIYRNIDKSEMDFVFVCMQNGAQFFEEEIEELGGKIIKIPPPREDGILKHFFRLIKIMKHGKFRAVHAHTSFHCGIVAAAGWIVKIPVRVAHARTTSTKHNTKKAKFSLIVGRLLINTFSTDKLAISIPAGEYLFGKSGFIVLPNAINYEQFLYADRAHIEHLKTTFSIPRSSRIVGMVGRFESMKNHDFAINWLAHYTQNNRDITMVFVGDGPLIGDMKEKATLLGVEQNVIFTGLRKDVYAWMHIFDVLIVPSKYEGLGGGHSRGSGSRYSGYKI